MAQDLPLMIVEDSHADFEIVCMLLREGGLTSPIVHCESGEEALTYATAISEQAKSDRQQPAHVLIDLNLPGMSGLEVLRELRSLDAFRLIPITILTTSSQPQDVEGSYQAGANSYLVKPVNFQRFEEVLRGFTAYWFEMVQLVL